LPDRYCRTQTRAIFARTAPARVMPMCTTAFSTPTVCDKALCPTFILKPSSFYQDKLSTNIGNTQQKDRFLRYILLSSLGAHRKQHDHESVASSLVVHLIALLRHFAANRCSVSFLPAPYTIMHDQINFQSNAPGALHQMAAPATGLTRRSKLYSRTTPALETTRW
jgi:hypothetical protein